MRPPSIRHSVIVPAALILACRQHPPQQAPVSLSSPQPRASVLRLPRGGGPPAIFRLPALQPAAWQARDPLPALRNAVGTDVDGRLAYVLTDSGQIVAVELESARARRILSRVRRAVAGPDGTVYAVGDSNHVTLIRRGNPARFTHPLPGRPEDLFGALGDELMAVLSGDPVRLVRLGEADLRADLPIARGATAATQWGELVAVAADSAVVLYETLGRTAPEVLPVSGRARVAAFSASGHRLYVARAGPGLLQYDRFSWRELGQIDLPGEPAALRPDPFGQWLLVRPQGADSVWVVDLARGAYLAGWPTRWADDLPAVAGGTTLLLRQGNDLVAYDLSAEAVPESGRIRGGAADLWLALPWAPGAAGGARPDSAPVPDPVPAAGGQVFLQVSSSQNPDWAQDLAQALKEQGFRASIVKPREVGGTYRVVIGPYETRAEAEADAQQLGRPYFVYREESER